MKRYEIIDAIEEIQDNNSRRFVGMNESELWTREDIADFVLKLLAEKDAMIEKAHKHIKLLLSSMDGSLDALREEYGESYPELKTSIEAKKYLKDYNQ